MYTSVYSTPSHKPSDIVISYDNMTWTCWMEDTISNSALCGVLVYWQYCGEMKSHPTPTGQSLYTDASEVTVSFRSSRHSSDRGFQLSYSTVNHTGRPDVFHPLARFTYAVFSLFSSSMLWLFRHMMIQQSHSGTKQIALRVCERDVLPTPG